MEKKLFDLGRIVMTKGVGEIVKENLEAYIEVSECLERHQVGDWVEVCEEDKKWNDWYAEAGERVLSCYRIGENKERIWIITEWDRSVTTILLPKEY